MVADHFKKQLYTGCIQGNERLIQHDKGRRTQKGEYKR
jgi:hypothetical protein